MKTRKPTIAKPAKKKPKRPKSYYIAKAKKLKRQLDKFDENRFDRF